MGVRNLEVSYKKLWKLLIDKNMKKIDLRKAAGISEYTMGRLVRNENVYVDVLAKVCRTLDCGFDDIVEITSKDEENM